MAMEKRSPQNVNLDTHSTTVRWDRDSRSYQGWSRIDSTVLRPNADFNNLFYHINVDSLREAFFALDGSKAVGLDGIRKSDYNENLEANLENLCEQIHRGSYKPQNKREVLIPKANGKTRPIAISCFEDKLVEYVTGKILSSIYEPLFSPNSFGFRPKKSAYDAIQAIYHSLKDTRRSWVVEMDFANFFNSIPHEKLLEVVRHRISDKRFLALLNRFLKGGIFEQSGTLAFSEIGTPQGSIMSPILANVYLNEVLDQWFQENYRSDANRMARYADDAVFMFEKQETAERFLMELNRRVSTFGLLLNQEKTALIDFCKDKHHQFSFLGFTFYWGRKFKLLNRVLKVKTDKKTLIKKMQEYDHWIKKVRSFLPIDRIWTLTKLKLKGHYNYYGFVTNLAKLNHFYASVVSALFRWLNRRSQRISFSWPRFNHRLKAKPLPKPPEMSKLKPLGWCPYV